MELLQIEDQDGVAVRIGRRLRRRVYYNKVRSSPYKYELQGNIVYQYLQGPNFLWHLDEYDKLSPYGFHIHGCIDGYERMKTLYDEAMLL